MIFTFGDMKTVVLEGVLLEIRNTPMRHAVRTSKCQRQQIATFTRLIPKLLYIRHLFLCYYSAFETNSLGTYNPTQLPTNPNQTNRYSKAPTDLPRRSSPIASAVLQGWMKKDGKSVSG